jgi:hypothetical protein
MKKLSFSLLITSVLASLVLASPVTAATPTTIVRDIANDTIVSSCGDVIYATITGQQVLHFQPLEDGGFTVINNFHGSLTGTSSITGITWTSANFLGNSTFIVPPGGVGLAATSVSRIRITSSTGDTRFLRFTAHTTVTPTGDVAVSFFNVNLDCG